MNTRIVRLGRAIVLSILFFVTSFSLLGGSHGHPVHAIAGSLLLLGAGVHLRSRREWLRAVFSRPASGLTRRVRQLRRTDLWLMILSFLCAVTGISRALTIHGLETGLFSALHGICGALMILALGIHLLQHWGWLVNILRQPGNPKSEPVVQG